MKNTNTFNFSNFHIQDAIVFAGRVLIASGLCVLYVFLNGKLSPEMIGYALLVRMLFILWTIFSIYEYVLSWVFPRVKSIEFEQNHIIVNGKDKFVYSKDTFTAARVFKFTLIDFNIFLNLKDEEEGLNKTYFFGNVIWNKENSKRQECKEKIIHFETKLYEKFAYAYLCENSSENNTYINVDIKKVNRSHLLSVLKDYIPGAILMLLALINILVRPLFLFLFICSSALFIFAVLKGISFGRDTKVFINSAEITRTVIRFDGDLFNIGNNLKVTYLNSSSDTKKIGILPDGSYIEVSDGKTTKTFWLGPNYLYGREQVLIKYVLDSIINYIKSYNEEA